MKKKRLTSLLLAMVMVLALTPTSALAVHTFTSSVTVEVPAVGKTPATTGTSKYATVTKVEWSGELDANGCFKAGVAYTVTVTNRIMDDRPNSQFKADSAIISLHRTKEFTLSDDHRTITASYTFPPLKTDAQIAEENAQKEAEKQAKQDAKDQAAHAEELTRRWSKAEADAAYPLGSAFTLLVNEETTDLSGLGPYSRGANISQLFSRKNDEFYSLDGNLVPDGAMPGFVKNSFNWPLNYYRVNRVVYDLYREDDPSLGRLPNVTELWLSPKCDIQGILDNIGRAYYNDRTNFNTWNYTLFIPDSVYPNGPTYTVKTIPGCRVMLYSGDDVYAAAQRGKEAARDWCTSHSYTCALTSYDRLYSYPTCQSDMRYYYSCAKCGKCEYNPNHTFFSNVVTVDPTEDGGLHTACTYYGRILTDEHFLGLNANGDRVYLYACLYCGKDVRQKDLGTTYEYYTTAMGGEGGQAGWKRYLEMRKTLWSPGNTYYESALKATVEKDSTRHSYAVAADKYVSAKTSGWAKTNVQDAADNNLVDRDLLGADYTRGITRLQFCSIAVKMAEKMTGKAITPAPSGTFTDTDSEYVRKASAAGITSGVGSGKFDPNGALTRQQMAAFLYRALMYVEANSDTEYTVYDSKLSSYTDAGQLASWAKEPMAFMNALGLISGTSNTALSPNGTCTIEQALVVAYRSLDVGGIGWYQCVKSPADNMNHYSTSDMCCYTYGDRVWFTSSEGHCVDPYGRAGGGVNPKDFYAIKDR